MHIDGFHHMIGTVSKDKTTKPWNFEQFGYKGNIKHTGQSGEWPIEIKGGSVAEYVSRDVPWTTDTLAFGLRVRASSYKPANSPATFQLTSGRGNFLAFDIAGQRFFLWSNHLDNTLYLDKTRGNCRPTYATAYYFEITLHRASREIKVYVNGRLDMTVALPDALASARVVTVIAGWFPQADYQIEPESRDLRLLQYASFYAKEGERLGPVAVVTRLASQAKLDDWTGWDIGGVRINPSASDGLTSKDCITANSPGARATYKSSAKLPMKAAKVKAVKLGLFARKHPRVTAKVATVIGGGTPSQNATEPYLPEIKQQHPNVGSGWTLVEMTRAVDDVSVDQIHAAPFGVTLE